MKVEIEFQGVDFVDEPRLVVVPNLDFIVF